MNSPRLGREDALQIHILRYLRMTLPSGWIVMHTANKPRSAIQGSRERLLGAVAGWPDLGIYGPGPDGPSAWFIEVKTQTGKLSLVQRDVQDAIQDIGFKVGVARSVNEAANLVAQWGLPSRDASISRQAAE